MGLRIHCRECGYVTKRADTPFVKSRAMSLRTILDHLNTARTIRDYVGEALQRPSYVGSPHVMIGSNPMLPTTANTAAMRAACSGNLLARPYWSITDTLLLLLPAIFKALSAVRCGAS